MSYSNRFSVFQQMNERKAQVAPAPPAAPAYKAWKNKEVTADGKKIEKVVDVSSVNEFPDLIKASQKESKKNVLEGTSLASKLKEVIAAEEEAAILKRLKKGDTPEMIFRESCHALPLKKKMLSEPKDFTAPWWVTDPHEPIVFPSFRHKSLAEQQQERMYKRYGIKPSDTMLFDTNDLKDSFEDDKISLPMSVDDFEEPLEEMEVS